MTLALSAALIVLILWACFALTRTESRIHELKQKQAKTSGLLSTLDAKTSGSLIAILKLERFQFDARERKLITASVLGAMSMLFVFPLLSPLWLATWAGYIWMSRRASKVRRLREIERALPMTVDLLRLAVGAGLNITAALREVTAAFDNALSRELARALIENSRGRRLADALDGVIERTGEEVRPLIWTLTSTERYGAPLNEVLERLAREARVDQERRSEVAARRLSIQVLFPLAGCTLPAFALLTVVPLLAGSLTTLASNFG